MNELRLLFHPVADSEYRVQLRHSLGDNVPEPLPFTPFLEEKDYENLRWYLEDFMDLPDGGAILRARGIEGQLAHWGRRLYDALFTAPASLALLQQLLSGPLPRVLTVATEDPRLLRLPWELLADGAGPLANRVSVRRQLAEPAQSQSRAITLPLRILYIVSRPTDTGFIDPRLTTRSLFDALDPLEGGVRIDFCRPPTLARMEALLREAERANDPYAIVHFDGHGNFRPDIQLGELCFEKADDDAGEAKTDHVPADRLGALLAAHQIPLVVLEACRSATVGETLVFRSVAPRLIQAGVASVLSMGHAVHVEAARRLLERFYLELARGSTIGEAVAQARAALLAAPQRWIEPGPRGRAIALSDWFLPHLYQRGLDEPLLPPALPDAPPPPRQFDVFLSHQHADGERVERLARTLTDKHGLRVWLDKWECQPGPLEEQCAAGIVHTRYTIVVGSKAALKSHWVQWEIDHALLHHPGGKKLLPIKFEKIKLPPDLDKLLWVDFTDPAKDDEQARLLTRLIRSTDAEDARARRGFRSAAALRDEAGVFPPPPLYGFQGRARELHQLERAFRRHRGIVIHAMGGMGKTTLATEAAQWWTRAGLFRDGACFLSFEQFASAERAIQVLGVYLAGPNFEALPAVEQRRRAIELFDQKEVLFVWDNFESVLEKFNEGVQAGPYADEERARLSELFHDLTASPKGRGRLLVTCRPGDTGLPGARRLELHGLARPDSLWLLSRVIAKDSLTLDDPRLTADRLNPLLETLADHPLSIELVVPHLKQLAPEQIVGDFAKLLPEFKRRAGVERNESLLASLAFSTRRLSAAAQAALPWLGLFSGGVFEDILLDVSGLDPQAWEAVRGELEATALVRVESDMLLAERPYLRFHPTLAYAAEDRAVVNVEETRKRFISVYDALDTALRNALQGSNSRGGMEVLAREEANFRTAVRWALDEQQYAVASALGNTFALYLQWSGRLRELDALVTWLAAEVRKGGFSVALAERENEEAWTLFTQGQAAEAIRRLENLLERLRETTKFDPAFQLAVTQVMLGRVLHNSGQSERAIPVLENSVAQWELLVRRAGQAKDRAERGNLAVTLGDLSNAFRNAGRLDEALKTSERGLDLNRELGNEREVAAALGQCASILMVQGRHAEADSHYDDAIAAARRAGDKGLEGIILQHQGRLADDMGQYNRAASLYGWALKLFQEMNDNGAIMLTYNLLGVVERKQGRLAEARSWYERSREIAQKLGNVVGLGQAAQNIGIVCQEQGKAARQQGREPEARQHFEEAKQFIVESLGLEMQRGNEPAAALSLGQLAQVHLLLGELDEAERYAKQCLEIDERLSIIPELPTDYDILAHIARARGDEVDATEWERKRDAIQIELARRARGPGDGLSPHFLKAIQQLCLACAKAGVAGSALSPDEESALAQVAALAAPWSELAPFLRRLAAGELPALPAGLPAEVQDFLTQLLRATGQN